MRLLGLDAVGEEELPTVAGELIDLELVGACGEVTGRACDHAVVAAAGAGEVDAGGGAEGGLAAASEGTDLDGHRGCGCGRSGRGRDQRRHAQGLRFHWALSPSNEIRVGLHW